jgi:hypothetical protein
LVRDVLARLWTVAGRAEDAAPVGIVIAGGAAVVTAAALECAAIPASAPGARLAVFAAAVAGFAALAADLRPVAAVTGLAALVFNGFLVNRLGELSWHGVADLGRLIVLVAAAAAGVAAGGGYRVLRRARLWRQRHRQLSAWVAEELVGGEVAARPVSGRAAGRRERHRG